ncbi:MAG: membrane dipeptidase [Acidobacteriota bacterium]
MSDIPAVADLHCDLLAYLLVGELTDESRSPLDTRALCSLPQLRDGGVGLQVMAIFTLTEKDWTRFGIREAELFATMLDEHDQLVRPVRSAADLGADERVGLMAAIENASAFAEEDEPLDDAFARFETVEKLAGPLLYVSMTWNTENRFGGGNASDNVGLKPDGRVLLDFLAEQRTSIDLSHTSPRLADDILDYTAKMGLDLPVLASHSVYAGVKDIPRNLRDEAAREVAERGGVIGLNLLRSFVEGEASDAFVRQLRHARDLGVLDRAQVLGTDFFYRLDIPPEQLKDEDDFFPEYGDATCHPRLLRDLGEAFELDAEALADLAHGRAYRFVERVLG